MPLARINDLDLYYERSGTGPRLLFLNGSGVMLEDSRLLLSVFTSQFDLLAYDQRGIGRSGTAECPYGMAECAGDALALLDVVGWPTACVLGVSFGGMVAQELAVTAPGRVERLALLCTSPGGMGGSSYPLHELDQRPDGERNEIRRRLMDTRFDDAWLASHPVDLALVAMMEGRTTEPDPERRRGMSAQLGARRSHDVWDRLPSITCPTYIAGGRYDDIAPPRNSAAIASRIEGAELHTYDGGHAFFAQDPRAIPDIIGFLSAPRVSTEPPPGH
jgi:pimeloyl-ACP methyl ester carboxylesterase